MCYIMFLLINAIHVETKMLFAIVPGSPIDSGYCNDLTTMSTMKALLD